MSASDRNLGAVQRASSAMVIEPARKLDKRRAALGIDQLQEIDQQLMVEMSGTATSVTATSTTQVTFDIGFMDATEQRYSPFTVPLFTYGFALLSVGPLASGSPGPVPMVSAAVLGWTERPGPVIIGATVALSAAIPGLAPAEEIDFSGYLHMNFQGYGALEENEPDLDA